LLYNVVTIGFLAKIPQSFARKEGSWFERLRVFIDVFVEPPFKATRTFPKFNGIVLA